MRWGRRQRFDAAQCRIALGALAVASVLGPRPAEAADLWAPSALFPHEGSIASVSWGAFGEGRYASGVVPPFRAAERDRWSAGATAGVWLARRVAIGASWEWLGERSTAGEPVSGAGDVRLGTVVLVASPGPLRFSTGWEAKMPNASDEGELGTDETDVLFGASAGVVHGALDARVDVGLGVLGNPLRFANQDDVPLLRGTLGAGLGPLRIEPRIEADLGTPRNPARTTLGVALSGGKVVFGRVEGALGLCPAAPDWSASIGVGVRGPLPDASRGE